MARSIIIFMRNALPYLYFVFFSKSGGRNNAQYALLFNTLLKITAHNTQKRRKRKERTCMDLHKWPSRRYSRKVTHPILNPNRQGLTWEWKAHRVQIDGCVVIYWILSSIICPVFKNALKDALCLRTGFLYVRFIQDLWC